MDKEIKSASQLYKELDVKEQELDAMIKKLDAKHENDITNDTSIYVTVGGGELHVEYKSGYDDSTFGNIIAQSIIDIKGYNDAIKLIGDEVPEKSIKAMHPYEGLSTDDIKDIVVDSRLRVKLIDKRNKIQDVMRAVKKLYTQEELLVEANEMIEEKELLK